MKRNNMNMLKGIRNGLCFLLVAGMVACTGENTTGVEEAEVAEAEGSIGETEEVVSDTWDNNEFNSTFASTNYYEDWDTNDDNLLEQNEYNAGLYDTWDVNNDNRLDENEWNTASNDWGLENETWSEWDTGGDGALDENEFATGLGDNSWFGDWDTDDDNMLG
ncbi:hypothetical protein ACFS7Z_27225, partial [Pontibacter toksunensis]